MLFKQFGFPELTFDSPIPEMWVSFFLPKLCHVLSFCWSRYREFYPRQGIPFLVYVYFYPNICRRFLFKL